MKPHSNTDRWDFSNDSDEMIVARLMRLYDGLVDETQIPSRSERRSRILSFALELCEYLINGGDNPVPAEMEEG